MNGRVYDPELGRMLSPDPVTQAPENGQNYNRYSYAYNNPLRYTDPSGFSALDDLLIGPPTSFDRCLTFSCGVAPPAGFFLDQFALSPFAGLHSDPHFDEEGTFGPPPGNYIHTNADGKRYQLPNYIKVVGDITPGVAADITAAIQAHNAAGDIRQLSLGGPHAEQIYVVGSQATNNNIYRNVDILKVLQGTVGAVELAAGGLTCAISRGLLCTITTASGVRNIVEAVTGVDIVTAPLIAVGVPQSGANAAGVIVDIAQIAAFPAVVINGVFFGGWSASGVILNSLLAVGGASGIPSAVTSIPDPTGVANLYKNP